MKINICLNPHRNHIQIAPKEAEDNFYTLLISCEYPVSCAMRGHILLPSAWTFFPRLTTVFSQLMKCRQDESPLTICPP